MSNIHLRGMFSVLSHCMVVFFNRRRPIDFPLYISSVFGVGVGLVSSCSMVAEVNCMGFNPTERSDNQPCTG